MKTIVYVDGFNFYYGCLKGAAYQSLDIVELFRDCLLPSSSGVSSDLLKIHYFTSQPSGRLALPQVARVSKSSAELYASEGELLHMWHMEEKQADVCLALEFLHDALSGNADQLVLCSSDADLVPGCEKVRKEKPDVRLGLVMPRQQESRKPDADLQRLAHWCRLVVHPEELAACASQPG